MKKKKSMDVWITHLFNFCSFNEEIVHISGSLVPVHTGSIHWLAKHLEDDTATDRFQLQLFHSRIIQEEIKHASFSDCNLLEICVGIK